MDAGPGEHGPLCRFPLLHDFVDGVYIHRPDGSFCDLLNAPTPDPDFYDAYDWNAEAERLASDAIERGAAMWRRDD